ncbi:type IV pilin-like G/H family protein [Microcoleus sp. F8-D3]
MSQQDSKSASISPNGCGCLLLLMGIGVIGAIALSSLFLDASDKPMISKAKQSEAKHYVGSMNRAQQALFIEKSAFATSVNVLGLGIKTETTNYKYSVRATKQTAFNYGVSNQKDLKSYVGGVFLVPAKNFEPNAAKEEITTTFILCEADIPGPIKPAEPTYENGKIACGQGTKEVTK